MPKDETRAKLELLVALDSASYKEIRTQLTSIWNQRQSLHVDDRSIEQFASLIRDAVSDAGQKGSSDVLNALNQQFQLSMSDTIQKYAEASEAIAKATSDSDMEAALKDQLMLAEKIQTAAKNLQKQKEALAEYTKKTTIGADEVKSATSSLTEGFLSNLSRAKSADLEGFAKAAIGAIGKAAGAGADLAKLGARASASSDQAKAMEQLAASLTVVSATVASVGAALLAVVAVLKMADDQARDLNKTFLDGASVADFAFKGVDARLVDVTDTMEAARDAAVSMADDFRGDAKEYAAILGQLNQAGYSYREMSDGITDATKQEMAFKKAITDTFVVSQALGISISEVASSSEEWSRNLGFDQDEIKKGFDAILGAAMQGGFNVKRFYTSVSQATAGMAIYNVRMEEAAALLAKTSKILGDTDASDFIRSLTQGFTDESMTDRMKRIMIAGGKDTQRIFAGAAERTSQNFVDVFNNGSTKKALESAFQSVSPKFDLKVLNDPQAFQKSWGKMDSKSRRLVIAELRKNGDEQSAAASRQLETLSKVVDGANQGFDAQVKGIGALDMQGKLAYKLQTLGDKRLNDMSSVELAAFQQYAGISGAQLEQLMRVESQLQSDYELAKKNGEAGTKSFDEWIATNKDAVGKLEDVKNIDDKATWFARSTVKNTRSVFDVLSNTIAKILNDIYSLMGTWFASSKGLSKESMDKQDAAVKSLSDQRESVEKQSQDINDQIERLDETLATTGDQTAEHIEAAQKKDALVQQKASADAMAEYLRAQSRQVLMLDESQMSDLTDKNDVLSTAANALTKSGEDLSIIEKHLGTGKVQEVLDKRAAIDKSAAAEVSQRYQDAYDASGAEMAQGLGSRPATADTSDVAARAETKKSSLITDLLSDSFGLSEDQSKTLTDISSQGEKGFMLDKKVMDMDKKFNDSFPDVSQKSTFEAMKLYQGWLIGMQQGLQGDDLDQAAKDWASGVTQAGHGKLAAILQDKGITATSYGAMPSAEPTTGQDFVMRPGQKAQLFSSSDSIVGMKPGGPLDKALQGGGTGGVVNINIHGGDQAAVYQTVKSALKNSGLRP